jgi:DNA-binding transcriptional LysR family regulator
MYDWAELRHFRYLLTILERQGFRVAAEELHTSQPNLSVQARQFQENASVRLYKKLKNGRIRPTETGLAFISLAKLLLETRDEVINALLAIERGEIGSVRFGCAPLVDQSLFRSFCAMHKELLPTCSSLTDIPNISQKGTRLGNWLTREQAKELLAVPDRSTLKGKRDYVILALLVGCALRRNELAELDVATIQQRERAVGAGRPRGQRPAYPHRRHPDLGQAGYQRLDDRGRNRERPAVAVDLEVREDQWRQPERLGGLVGS